MSNDLVKRLWLGNAAHVDARILMRDAAYRIKELEAENNLLKNSGIVEVAARNPNVMEYMRHWEGRTETAEAKLRQSALQELSALGQAHDAHQARLEAEAKLAKVVEALEKLNVGEGWAAQIARTTLAELTGGKDE